MAALKKVSNREILSRLLEGMCTVRRREWFIKIMMSERDKSLRDIASQAGITAWYLSDGIRGKLPLSRRVITVLETTLEIDLTPFLTAEDGK